MIWILEGINYLKFQINIFKNKKVIKLIEPWQLWLMKKNSEYNSVVFTTLKREKTVDTYNIERCRSRRRRRCSAQTGRTLFTMLSYRHYEDNATKYKSFLKKYLFLSTNQNAQWLWRCAFLQKILSEQSNTFISIGFKETKLQDRILI